ncbi:lasso peptide biosynthesis B2 protein [Streptomyces triculaminicus]|uniref:lasso peptide biosynthesis B2 protein n=1 Tax=Streptomyces triculaminicus TaxID=2816232 RepID=UPI003F4CD536
MPARRHLAHLVHRGVRTPPFAAHAWVEADGQRVGEPHDTATYRTLLTVPPH